jgi:hypothetical protein
MNKSMEITSNTPNTIYENQTYNYNGIIKNYTKEFLNGKLIREYEFTNGNLEKKIDYSNQIIMVYYYKNNKVYMQTYYSQARMKIVINYSNKKICEVIGQIIGEKIIDNTFSKI